MYMMKGTITTGGYSGGEYNESSKSITISAMTRKKLQKKKEIVTEKHTSSGSAIDFGFTSGTAFVTWSPQLWKLVDK